ncbi:histidinol-phosphate transaminase [Paraburkholderia silvatlantica]|uniref:Histidinol-phosphate aminotransferase n=1 Tax=Paraburkholderia silvatlantica TaxID=321895 RepID=A0A2U1AL05_9BURK|nr:histidinol-phosphate transaminase [Paraburkholderia silvatlantica]MBB2927383.1 histidinol-phosphate aminotransferase [Paraburkholderia silvatlantica]PVY37098.1 histidinol-phosphate aminotransferase [Paraburkholderia silvatlantica]PXW41624.1 histidinol-phosphate aminotransferase [Paraburkholderia silvatlantica]PYE13418.1 histidinol-phosphate aminotransferase [Paraburkholderia silvatlantica]TDQ73648.1 histidinol-phosphate aminotransferase [Paraburkholderia silvatlantica]
MSRYWSDIVNRLVPYVPGEQPALAKPVKLNTNENPYAPSPRVLEAIRHELGETGESLRRYPDPVAKRLRATVAAHHGIRAEQVFVGNGSDEVLAHAFQALLKHDKPILFPDITYSFYPTYARLYEVEYRTVPLTGQFTIRVDDYRQPNGGVIFPNPNAPTGHALPLAEIERLVAANTESVVVIDEAYVDFGAESAIALIDRYPNLLVVHTTSKSRSLAGMRVGFAFGHPDLIDALNRVKDSFNSYPLDRLAQAAATAAYEDGEWLRTTRARVIASRERLTAALTALGFDVVPSAANFVFATHPAHDAAAIAARLREKEIFVRHFNAPRVNQYLRISIGTDAECDTLVDALKAIVG